MNQVIFFSERVEVNSESETFVALLHHGWCKTSQPALRHPGRRGGRNGVEEPVQRHQSEEQQDQDDHETGDTGPAATGSHGTISGRCRRGLTVAVFAGGRSLEMTSRLTSTPFS